MKNLKRTLLILFLLTIGHANGEYHLSMNQLLRETSVGNPELDEVFAQAQESAQLLNKEVQESNKKLQENLTMQTNLLKKQYQQQAAILRRKTAENTAAITGQAMKNLLKIVSDAEIKALEVKNRKREEKLEHALEAMKTEILLGKPQRQSLTLRGMPRWKKILAKDFSGYTTYLKQIITRGETPEEAEDFLEIFEDQEVWFNDTLKDITSSNDPRYNLLIRKKQALENLINAHKNAVSILKERLGKIRSHVSSPRLKLLTLYELNDFMKTTSKTDLTSEDLEVIVNRVLQKQLPKADFETYKDMAPTGQVTLMTREMLEQELDNTLKKLQKTEQMLGHMQEEMKTFREETIEKIEDERSKKLELDLQNKNLTEHMQNLNKRIEEAEKEIASLQKIKNDLVETLEKTTKENLSLETSNITKENQLKAAKDTIESASKKLEQAEKSLKEEEIDRRKAQAEAEEAKETAALAEELTERYIDKANQIVETYTENLEKKENDLNLQRNMISLEKELLDEQTQLFRREKEEVENRNELEQELDERMKQKEIGR